MSDTGFVPFPNEIIDNIMPELSANGWKVFCFVWRKTQGWRKRTDKISYSQIKTGTGIKHKVTLKKAIDEIAGVIAVAPGIGRANMYEFDISEWFIDDTIKGSESEPLSIKGSLNAPINPIKGSLSDVKGSENEPTTNNIQQTKKEVVLPPNENQIQHRDLALKAAKLLGIDHLPAKAQVSTLNTATQWLASVEATPADLDTFSRWWYTWATTPPGMKQVKEKWTEALAKSNTNGHKPKSGIVPLPGIKEALARIEAENG